MQRIRTIVVEDENLYRDLLKEALGRQPRIDVVGAFADGESAMRAAPALAPDVAILDIELGPSANGVQTGLVLRRQLPQLGIVLLSNHCEPAFLKAVPPEQLSGWSYLLKRSVQDLAALARAVEGAAAGLVVLDARLVAAAQPRQGGRLERLTPRQLDILSRIAQGFTNTAIAQSLGLTEKSVENQINVLYQQLEIDRTDPTVQPRVTAVLRYLQETRLRVTPTST